MRACVGGVLGEGREGGRRGMGSGGMGSGGGEPGGAAGSSKENSAPVCSADHGLGVKTQCEGWCEDAV